MTKVITAKEVQENMINGLIEDINEGIKEFSDEMESSFNYNLTKYSSNIIDTISHMYIEAGFDVEVENKILHIRW